ncbi:hypothetical protein, partial [Dysosmobacter sp.]|uniref:hypothetical protein n=1 Tax=Dysosmobacter sp. TaxID=2591382 RepID=UPI00307B1EFC
VCGYFILPEPASYVFFYAFSICATYFTLSLSKSQFFSATGDILEMQPVVFMNWCDSNARASKKNKPTGHRSLPHGEQVDGLFSSPMVLMLLLLRLCVIPWWYW